MTQVARLRRVAGFGLAGLPHDGELLGIARLAARLCGARSAVVSLLDGGPGTGDPGTGDPGTGDPGTGDERDGTEPPLFAVESPLHGPGGELLGTLSVFDDDELVLDPRQRDALVELADQVVQVLDLRRRESHLLDAVGELLRTNDELTAFAGRVAHDLRAPLTAVLGFLALADGPFRDETSQRAGDCVGSALDAARRMRTLIDDLLAYATFEARPQPGPVDLRGLVDDVVDDLAEPITLAAAVVSYAGPAEVVGDRTLLRQLLQNLVANAVTHGGSQVLVTASTPAGALRLEVTDDGPGVPPADRERIFDPLVRLAGPGGGSGIGLATCARIVEALGGTVDVGEAPEGGAAFRVVLPSRS